MFLDEMIFLIGGAGALLKQTAYVLAKVKEMMVEATGAVSHVAYYRLSGELCPYDESPFSAAKKSGSRWYQCLDG